MKECNLISSLRSFDLDTIPSKLFIECLHSNHWSIQLFSCLWHLPTMLQVSFCHTYSQDEASCSQWSEQLVTCPGKLLLSLALSHFISHSLYDTVQSAYHPGHSTEKALLTVINDLFHSLSIGNMSVLALLDFSSAFDKIDLSIIVHRLHSDSRYADTVIQWHSFYLTDRTQHASLSKHHTI